MKRIVLKSILHPIRPTWGEIRGIISMRAEGDDLEFEIVEDHINLELLAARC
jgi:hypothetical protein